RGGLSWEYPRKPGEGGGISPPRCRGLPAEAAGGGRHLSPAQSGEYPAKPGEGAPIPPRPPGGLSGEYPAKLGGSARLDHAGWPPPEAAWSRATIAAPMSTAVFADALYDPATARATHPAVVLIDEGRVVAAGPRDQVHVPADALRVDAEGLTVLPGLIDCHVHLCIAGDGVVLAEMLASPPSLTLLSAVVACRNTLDAGFTTVRDAGLTPAAVRIAVERGYFPGPRMLLAVAILSQTGGHADQHFPCGVSVLWNPAPDVPESVVDGAEPMRQRVRE